MVAYATEELAVKLLALTTQQRSAIARIVEHVYINNQPMAHLLTGDDKIVSESNYYRNGTMDPDTGKWKKKPGWGKDPLFQDALTEAARLALQARTREEVAAWSEAKRRARLATPAIVDSAIEIANDLVVMRDANGEVVEGPHGGPLMVRRAQDKDRVAAIKTLLDYAKIDLGAVDGTEAERDEEADWWAAAEDDDGED